jgi:hypothetical protein
MPNVVFIEMMNMEVVMVSAWSHPHSAAFAFTSMMFPSPLYSQPGESDREPTRK